MPNDMSRHELNKNQLADYIDSGIDWALGNRNTFYAVAGTAAGLLLFGIFFFTRLQEARLRNEEKLSMADYMVRGNDASQAEQGMNMLSEVIRNSPTSSTGLRAAMVKANALMARPDYAGAEAVLVNAIDGKNGDKKLLPFLYSMLGILYENTGKLPQAIGIYNSYLGKFPDHFLTPRIYESLGRAQELSDQQAEAKATYERIVTMYPASPWAQNAQERLINISNMQAAAPHTPSPRPLPAGK
jgi:tetratricopeptide (TPR) repeat protein